MSVPKSKRKESSIEYLALLQKIEIYFIELWGREYENPKIAKLSNKMADMAIDLYNDATMFFEVSEFHTFTNDLANSKKYCKKVIYGSRQLASQINILVAIKMNQNKPIKQLIETTYQLKKVCDKMTILLAEMKDIK